jgi:hypothetical protein
MNTYWLDYSSAKPSDCPSCEHSPPTDRYSLNVVNLETNRVSIMNVGRGVLDQLVTYCDRLELLREQREKARAFRLNRMRYRTQR